MSSTFVRKWFVILPLTLLITALCYRGLTALAADRLGTWLASQATQLGVDLQYDDIRVGVFGVEITELQVDGLEIGSAKVDRITALVDWSDLAARELHFRSIALSGVGINLDEVFWAQSCQELSFCGKDEFSRRSSAETRSSGGQPVASRPRLPSFRGQEDVLATLADTWTVIDLQVDVASGDWASITAHHLVAHTRGTEAIIEGNGYLSSPYAVEGSDFKFSGQLGASGAIELAVGLENPLEFATPAAHLSTHGLGVVLDRETEFWLEDVTITPFLLDFTGDWRAQRVVINIPSGGEHSRIELAGLAGRVDLESLQELAVWLENYSSSHEDSNPELADLRDALLRGLADTRSALYGADLLIALNRSNLTLSYDDGTTFTLEEAELVVDGDDRMDRPAVQLYYRGHSPQPERWGSQTGQRAVGISALTAGRIADWTRR